MGMKLLTPTQQKDLKEQQNLKEILRAQELEKAAAASRVSLANAQADFNATLAKNREIWALEELEHENRVKERKAEINALEAQKLSLLIPLDILKDSAITTLNDAEAYVASLRQREEDNESLTETLQDMLDEVGQKGQDIERAKQILDIKTEEFLKQSKLCEENNKRLALATAEFMASKQAQETILETRKTNLTLEETSLNAKAEQLKAKELKLANQATDIDKAKIELDAKRQEALRPVAVLEAEAKFLRDKVQLELKDAENNKLNAVNLHKQAKLDYDNKLSQLDNKQKALEAEEFRIAELKKEAEKQAKFIYSSQNALDAEWVKLKTTQEGFIKEKHEFDEFKLKHADEVKAREDEAIKQEERATELLAETQNNRLATADLLAKINIAKQELVKNEENLKIEIARAEQVKNEAFAAQNDAKAAINQLNTQQEGFAVWRNEAEILVTDKAATNTKLAAELDKKASELREQEKFLANWSVTLKDERGVLDRAWKELEKKKQKISP